MRIRFLAATLTVAVFACAPLFSQSAAGGFTGDLNSKPPAMTKVGPAPRTPDGKPDLSGLWARPYVPDMTKSNKRDQEGTAELPFTPDKTGDFVGQCSVFCGSGHGGMKMTMHVVN